MGIRKLLSQSFFKSFLVLAGGNLIAQLIQVISYPFVTRFFTPTDFGIKALFTTILILATTFSTGKYEEAIPIPNSDEEAIHIVGLSALLSVLVAICLGIFFLLFGNYFFQNYEGYNNWVYVFGIPIGVFSVGLINTFSQWHIRKKDFQIMSKVKVIQSSAKASFELYGGWMGFSGLILICGVLIGMGSGFFTYLKYFLKQVQNLGIQLKQSFSKAQLISTLYRFINFPKFAIASGLIDRLNVHLPILFFTLFSTMEVLGHYSIVVLLVAIPNVIFIESILKIFHSELSNKLNFEKHQIMDLFFKNAFIVTGICLIIIFCFFLFGKIFLLFAFGNQWGLAGELLPYYSITLLGAGWFYISLYVFTLLEKQKLFLYYNFGKLLFLILGFYFCWHLEFSSSSVVKTYSIGLVILSFLQLGGAFLQLRLLVSKA